MRWSTFYNLFKRELKTFFVSPIAYIVSVIFLIVTGWFFFSSFFLVGRTDIRDFFALLPIILVFFVPAITMRQFAEEYSTGSFEIVSTLPVSSVDILAAKYVSAFVFVVAMILPTVAYPLSISGLGALDWGPVIGGYIGAILLAGTYAAVGTFVSSLTKNQIVAFIGAMAICFFLYFIDKVVFFFPAFIADFLEYLGADYHFRNFERGLIDSRDIVYFLTVIILALFGTHLAMRERQ